MTEGGDPYVGRTLGGTYRIVSRLGAGATGVVYLARHTLLDQDFAVKVLAPALAQDPDVRRRLLLEARSLTLFTHKHAVQVRHCGEDQGALYLAMDLCRGETLTALMEREGLLSEDRAARIVLQALEALGEAHDAGIVHRDLKPSNMMVETTVGAGGAHVDRLRILDFGLARIVGSEMAALPGALASLGGHVVGTVAYMSPEQLRAEDDVDGRSDLFSLGAVFYELVGGALPFAAASTMSIALRILEREPPPLPDAGPHGVSAPLRAVISRALEKDRGRRFQTAAEFAAAVTAALGGVAPKPLPRPPAVPGRRRRLGVAAVIVGTMVVLVAIPAWFVMQRAQSRIRHSRDQGTESAATYAAAEGRWTDAISLLTDLVEAGAASGEVFLARANARNEIGDTNARSDLDEAARLLGDDPRVLTARGRFFWSVLKPADTRAAHLAFEKALAVSPGHLEARLERARMCASEKEYGDAETDLDAVEKAAPEDPRAPLLRAEIAIDRAGHSLNSSRATGLSNEERSRVLRETDAFGVEGAAQANKAADLDPDWASGPNQTSRALGVRAYVARDSGDHDRSRALFQEAKAAATEAVRRIRERPGHRSQGRLAKAYLSQRAGIEMAQDDYEAAGKDWEEILRGEPNDPVALAQGAYAHMQVGDYEAAIREYERLSTISTSLGHVEYHAFCYQRVGFEALLAGDRAKAVDHLTKSIEQYSRVIARAGGMAAAPAVLHYRAETYVLRAKAVGEAARPRDLDAAKADFDALSRPDGSMVKEDGAADGEALHRRFDYWMEMGEPRKALDDIRAAIGEEKGKNASFYARRAKGALTVAKLEADAGAKESVQILVREATEAANLCMARVPETAPMALVLRARAAIQRIWIETGVTNIVVLLADAERDLGKALTAARDATERAEAHYWMSEFHRARTATHEQRPGVDEAVAEAQEAVRIREEEHRAGRWSLSADYYRRLADALDAATKPDEAKAARARADAIEAEAKAPPR